MFIDRWLSSWLGDGSQNQGPQNYQQLETALKVKIHETKNMEEKYKLFFEFSQNYLLSKSLFSIWYSEQYEIQKRLFLQHDNGMLYHFCYLSRNQMAYVSNLPSTLG